MATEIKMPQLGETVVEGTITRWLKKEGDTIEPDEYIVEISTDKVDSEVPSSAGGVIQKLLVNEGETVQVGTPIAVVGEEGESEAEGAETEQPAEKSESEESEAEQPAAESEQPAAESEQPAEKSESEQPAAGESEPAAAEAEPSDTESREPAGDAEGKPEPAAAERTPKTEPAEPAAKAPGGDDSKRGIISPLVRRLAEENDVDLAEVSGSGTGGRIRKQDVLRYVEERKARPAATPAAPAEPAPERAAQPAPERAAEPAPERAAEPAPERPAA